MPVELVGWDLVHDRSSGFGALDARCTGSRGLVWRPLTKGVIQRRPTGKPPGASQPTSEGDRHNPCKRPSGTRRKGPVRLPVVTAGATRYSAGAKQRVALAVTTGSFG